MRRIFDIRCIDCGNTFLADTEGKRCPICQSSRTGVSSIIVGQDGCTVLELDGE